MASWLIDDRGKMWTAEAHPIAQWSSLTDTVTYAISDLGFIHLRADGHALWVGFNPRRVSRAAVAGAFYAVAEAKPERVLLWHGDENRDVEIAGTIKQALQRVEALLEASPAVRSPMLRTHRLALDRPHRMHRERVAALLRAWAELGHEITPERQSNLFDAGLLDNAVIVKNDGRSDRLLIEHWGGARDLLGSRWAQIARGRDVEDQPFRTFGLRVAATYRLVLEATQPRLYAVEAVMPQSDGQVMGKKYDRLLMPWRGRGEERFLTGINLITQALPI